MELINNILTAGIVPALFNDEEKDAVIGSCRGKAGEAGYTVTKFVQSELFMAMAATKYYH